MPKTEHAAPSCKELREAAVNAIERLESAGFRFDGNTVLHKSVKHLRRLTSGPTLEERLIGPLNNPAGWAKHNLRILSEMAEDKGIDWVAREAKRIADGIRTVSSIEDDWNARKLSEEAREECCIVRQEDSESRSLSYDTGIYLSEYLELLYDEVDKDDPERSEVETAHLLHRIQQVEDCIAAHEKIAGLPGSDPEREGGEE